VRVWFNFVFWFDQLQQSGSRVELHPGNVLGHRNLQPCMYTLPCRDLRGSCWRDELHELLRWNGFIHRLQNWICD